MLHRSVGKKQLHVDVVGGPLSDYSTFMKQMLVPHRHSFFHIVLFTRGNGTQIIDFEQFGIYPAQVYFMIPGQIHSWNFTGDIEGFVVNFSETLFSSFTANPLVLEQFRFLRGVPRDSVIDLNGDALEEALHFFKQAVKEINKKDSFSVQMVCFALMSLFISISRHDLVPFANSVPDQKKMTLFNFRKLVNQHFAEKKLPKDYATMHFITPSNLNALCNELLGKSAGQLIRERILLEAKKLLVNADISISEISFQLNFTDHSYFTKFFKKYSGVTPEAFRRNAIKTG